MMADMNIIALIGVILKYDPLLILLDTRIYRYKTNLKNDPINKKKIIPVAME